MRILGMGAVMLLMSGEVALAQGGAPATSLVELARRVSVGERLEIVDERRGRTAGTLVSVSEAAVTLRVGGRSRHFPSTDVVRVERRRPDSKRNGALIGLGTGAVVGTLVGPADSQTCPASGVECGQGALLGAIAGALWGAAAGWVVDTARVTRELIYLRPGAAYP
jgi:uncharacterized protein YcfJ